MVEWVHKMKACKWPAHCWMSSWMGSLVVCALVPSGLLGITSEARWKVGGWVYHT